MDFSRRSINGRRPKRQRTQAEFETAGTDSGWHVAAVLDVPLSPLAIIELDHA